MRRRRRGNRTTQPATPPRLNLARSLSRDLKHTGVTSNAIAAGTILVPTTRKYLMELGRENGWGETWEEVERNAAPIRAGTDVGRIGKPREYADLVAAYLASPISGYLTGATPPDRRWKVRPVVAAMPSVAKRRWGGARRHRPTLG